eukprot:CAMPEP_0197716134 /NCGR_PEP_ID=MMETSP1434-20131217/1127_1 /TAXON_ID=265543 /ORGANISM="Minutocellus polymorphus, Strain CCMP3303" /LENGTH=415 /DNA_ID=CAMNT_0043300449 /DNA_START=533 /DNA_END=1780 /DNA_ORIENTATION=-
MTMLKRHCTLLSPTITAIFSILLFAEVANSAKTIDVSFPSFDNFVLEGTFYLPLDSSGADSPPAKNPGVVLIHGSGPQSRDANLNSQVGITFPFIIPAFVEIATELQQLGIAVLTYDKRSCGTFNNCHNNSYPIPMPEDFDSIDVFLSDAQAALEYLQSREEVDSSRIVPIGHSQAGSYVPILLRDGPDGVVGGVVLEGPFHPVDQLIAYQLNYTLELVEDLYGMNATEAMQVPQVAGLVEFAEGVAAIRDGTSDEAVGGASSSFWRSWFQLSDEAQSAAAVVEQPLFVLNGELDTNVPVKEAYAWEEHLDKSGKAEYQVKILECVTHSLNCLAESDMTILVPATDIGTEVDTKVHDALASFVLSATSVGEDEDGGDGGSGDQEGSETTSSAWLLQTLHVRSHVCIFLLIVLIMR